MTTGIKSRTGAAEEDGALPPVPTVEETPVTPSEAKAPVTDDKDMPIHADAMPISHFFAAPFVAGVVNIALAMMDKPQLMVLMSLATMALLTRGLIVNFGSNSQRYKYHGDELPQFDKHLSNGSKFLATTAFALVATAQIVGMAAHHYREPISNVAAAIAEEIKWQMQPAGDKAIPSENQTCARADGHYLTNCGPK